MNGPSLSISSWLHASKYRAEGEDFRDYACRVAATLTEDDESYHVLRDILQDMRFLPGGRIQSAIGSPRRVTPYNCYVSGTIADSFTGHNGIMQRATEAAETMRMGGGIGYDFSTLRPRGADIKSQDTQASGVRPFLEIFNAICKTVASAGHRRGAQMAVLRVDHPDIEEFIAAKHNSDQLTQFNVSIGVTDKFMRAVERGEDFSLVFEDRVIRAVDARALYERIMRSAWDWAEPGILFLDRINLNNNLYYCETISATNPCGEQPLPPFGACLLGSLNLVKYIRTSAEVGPYGDWWRPYVFNWTQFTRDIKRIVPAMDMVVDVATYPLKEQEHEAKEKRRMGLGITGFANASEVLGYPYGSVASVSFLSDILRSLRDTSYATSINLAREKGSFPALNRDLYLQSEFTRTLPVEIREGIREHGIRNSHLLSIAPTGTISLCADNVSSGIEPVFNYEFERSIQTFEGTVVHQVSDYGFREWGVRGKTTQDCSISDHLAILSTAQKYIDSAVSKTCNVPNDTNWEDFKGLYFDAWKQGCKGLTVFVKDCKRTGILSEGQACYIDEETGRRECE